MIVKKNGYEFRIGEVETEVDREESHKVTNYNGYGTAVVRFNIEIAEIDEGFKHEYELVGDVEYSQDGADVSFYDGTNYVNNVTLVSGDLLDREFNDTVAEFFNENYDLGDFVYDHLSCEEQNDIEELIK